MGVCVVDIFEWTSEALQDFLLTSGLGLGLMVRLHC